MTDNPTGTVAKKDDPPAVDPSAKKDEAAVTDSSAKTGDAVVLDSRSQEDDAKATEYFQDQLDAQYKTTEDNAARVRRDRDARLVLAYGFKTLAVIGGIIITYGVPQSTAHDLGLAIAIAIAIDAIFSNHRRLLAAAAATKAYVQLLRTVRNSHQRELGTLLPKKNTKTFAKSLNDLLATCLSRLQEVTGQIEDQLADADIRALERLTLDEKKKDQGTN